MSKVDLIDLCKVDELNKTGVQRSAAALASYELLPLEYYNLQGCGGPVWVGFQIRSCNQWSIEASHLTQTIWSVRIYILDWILSLFSLVLGHQTALLELPDRLFHASQGALVLVYDGLIKMFTSSCDRCRSFSVLFDHPSKHLWNADSILACI